MRKIKCIHRGEPADKQRARHKTITDLCVVSAAIAFKVLLWNNYLLPWQIPLFGSRYAIIRYMKESHPNYHIVKEQIEYQYPAGTIIPDPFSGKPSAYITFNEEGFEYIVHAFDGKVSFDTYARHKLSYEIEKFAEEGFLEPRGIDNVDFYSEFALNDDELPSKWSEYNDAFYVTISVHGQGITPQDVGWLWDFYEFWRDNQHFNSNWRLDFDIYYGSNPNACWDSRISIHNTEKFDSKEEWYAENTYIPNH